MASILNATTPLFGIIIAHFVTADERLSRSKVLGVTFGFVGVVTLLRPDPSGISGGGELFGVAACMERR